MLRSLLITTLAIVFLAGVVNKSTAQEPPLPQESLATLLKNVVSTDPKLHDDALKKLRLFCRYFPMPESEWYDQKEFLKFRREAKPLLPDLLKMLKHSDEEIVLISLGLISRMGTDAQSATQELSKLVLDKQLSVGIRWELLAAALFITPENKAMIPLIFPSSDSLEILFFGDLEDDDIEALQKTDQGLPTIDASDISFLAFPIAQLFWKSGHTKLEIPHLLKATSDKYPSKVRALVLAILGLLESEAKSAVPELLLLLDDKDERIRHFAASAILQIEKNPQRTKEIMDRLKLKGKERVEHEKYANDFFKYQAKIERELSTSASTIPTLHLQIFSFMMKKGRRPALRQSLRALVHVGPAGKSAIPELKKALRDPDEETRQLAAKALKAIDPTIELNQ